MVCAKLRLGTCSIESLDTNCKNIHCLTVSFVNLYVPSKWKVFGDLTHNLDSKQNFFSPNLTTLILAVQNVSLQTKARGSG